MSAGTWETVGDKGCCMEAVAIQTANNFAKSSADTVVGPRMGPFSPKKKKRVEVLHPYMHPWVDPRLGLISEIKKKNQNGGGAPWV